MQSVYGFHSSLHKDPVPFPCHGLRGSANLAPVHLSRPICLYFLFAAWAVGTQVIIPGSFIIFRFPSPHLFPLLGALLLSSSTPPLFLLSWSNLTCPSALRLNTTSIKTSVNLSDQSVWVSCYSKDQQFFSTKSQANIKYLRLYVPEALCPNYVSLLLQFKSNHR